MPEAHLRFTSEEDEVLDNVVLFCRGQGKVILAVKELSKDGKKHIHLLINTSKTISTCGQLISKAFPAHVGNGSKSFTAFKKTLDDNILYCSKGTKELPPVVLFTTLESIVIENAHKKYWLDQEKFVTEYAADKKKVKAPNFIEKVMMELSLEQKRKYSYLQSIYNPSDVEKCERLKYEKEINTVCIVSLGKYAKTLDDNIVSRLINGVRLKCVTDYGHKEEIESIVQRLSVRCSDRLI